MEAFPGAVGKRTILEPFKQTREAGYLEVRAIAPNPEVLRPQLPGSKAREALGPSWGRLAGQRLLRPHCQGDSQAHSGVGSSTPSWLEPRPLPPPTALGGDSGFGLFQEGRGQLSLLPCYLDSSQPEISRRPRCPGDGGNPFALGWPALCSGWLGFWAQRQLVAPSRNDKRQDTGIWQCFRAEATENGSACSAPALSH